MLFATHRTSLTPLLFLFFLWPAIQAFAEDKQKTGKLKIHVTPKQAYIFVDGKAIRDGSQTIDLSSGTHEVSVHNYGYNPNTQEVNIDSGQTTDLTVTLQASGDKVAGPFGEIEFKGCPRDAVLLNGTTPDYFVGHVHEFDWNWIWHQRLLVKPGTYQVTITREGNPVWSGPVKVTAGQQVTVDLNKGGETKTKDWPEGNHLNPQPRFQVRIASATIPIAPVTAQLSTQSTSLDCGQSTHLNWNSADAAAVSITDLGDVSPNGNRTVSPAKTTTYELTAKGPGGVVTQTATIDVNAQPTATLTLAQHDVPYHKIGDKLVQQGTTTLSWSASNADQVTISSLGGRGRTAAKPSRRNHGKRAPARWMKSLPTYSRLLTLAVEHRQKLRFYISPVRSIRHPR